MTDEMLLKSLEDMNKASEEKDLYEVEYELEKSRMVFSAEVQEHGNQTQRDAKVAVLLDEKGMYRKMAELRTKSRKAYSIWSTFKTLKENK